MTRIVIVADKDTAKCFRLAGIKDVYSVQSVGEAEKRISELLENPDLTAILVTERISNQISATLEKVIERKHPIILPIPDVKGQVATKIDLIIELVRRKTGIEVKLR